MSESISHDNVEVSKARAVYIHYDKLVKALDKWRIRRHNWIARKRGFPDEIEEFWVLLRRKKWKLERIDLTRASAVALVSFNDSLVAAQKFIRRARSPFYSAFWLLVFTTPKATRRIRKCCEAVDESMKLVLKQCQEAYDKETNSRLNGRSPDLNLRKERLHLNRLRYKMLQSNHPFVTGGDTSRLWNSSVWWELRRIHDSSFSGVTWDHFVDARTAASGGLATSSWASCSEDRTSLGTASGISEARFALLDVMDTQSRVRRW
ncbi:hypothetical protein R1sor_025645 [Riccia sorocarpa]|uniref:Uncharacterized protein n=1 Tax=Riccia sorocarpa TaxID=122646 RepID=A0ABD3GBY2_9MARC